MGYNWYHEAMAEYAVGMTVYLLRVATRTRMVGVRGWKGDDYLVLVSMLCYTSQFICWKYIYAGSGVSYVKGVSSQEELDIRVRSLMANWSAWLFYLTFIWSLKGCLFFFYSRLTSGLGKSRFLKITGVIIAITYVVAILVGFLHCLPLEKVWRLDKYPAGTRGIYCDTGLAYFYFTGFLNIATDCMLLCIPIPMLWKVKLPLKRKAVVSVLMCSGVFLVIASLLRNIFGILVEAHGQVSLASGVVGWALREMLIAIIVVNAPCIKPLFTSSSWLKHSTSQKYSHSSGSGNSRSKSIALNTVGSSRSRSFAVNGTLSQAQWTITGGDDLDIEKGPFGSQTNIIPNGAYHGESSHKPKMEIHQTTTLRVSDEIDK